MKRKTKDWEIVSTPHDELMDGLEGVRITRRITLRGSVAVAMLLALGVTGCENEQKKGGKTDDDDSSGDNDESSDEPKKKNKKKKKKDSKGKSTNDDDSSKGEETGGDSEDDKEGSGDTEEDESTGGKGSEGDKEDDSTSSSKEEESTEDEPQEPLSLNEFLAAIIDDAKKATSNESEDEAAYLAKVEKFLKRLDHNVPKISAGGSFNMKSLKKSGPVTVYVMEIRPNAKIPLHNHVNHTGNVLGWRGECTTRNFTKVEGSGGRFLLQETDSRVIKKGDTGVLARVHNNFHMLEAGPEGSTLIDVFTYFPRAGGSRYVNLGKLVDKEKKIYEASWNYSLSDMDPRRDFD